jgi:RNAse (barnase) inhibitor barstar
LREEAEYLRIALAMDLIAKDAVVAWADRIIAVLDKPPIQVIDVSLSAGRPEVVVMDLLAAVPGSGDLAAAAHRALRLLLLEARAGRVPLERVVEALWAYSNWATVPEGERVRAGNLTDALICAQRGYYGTLESVRSEIEAFLVEHVAGDAPGSAAEGVRMNERREVVEIDLSAVTTPGELHTVLARALGFPDFYGRNWAAFWDAITGLVGMPGRLRLVGWAGFATRLPDEGRHLRGCLADALAQYPEWSAQVEYAE